MITDANALLSSFELELLCHMFFDGPVWDGNLIYKQARDKLVRRGLVQRSHGYNWLSLDGIDMAYILGFTKWKTDRHPRAGEMWDKYVKETA
jgi:hypothetical protein